MHLSVGEDANLWRFASVQEALMENRSVIARLIQHGEMQAHEAVQVTETREPLQAVAGINGA